MVAPAINVLKKITLAALVLYGVLELGSGLALLALRNSESFHAWQMQKREEAYSSLNSFDLSYQYDPYLGYRSKTPPLEIPKDSHRFRVAILGGSVAERFAIFLNSKEGADLVRQKLQENKQLHEIHSVEFINFAAGGYKQPQGLISSVLNLDKADLFLSIEGYNEQFMAPWGCGELTWPWSSSRFNPESHTIYRSFGQWTRDLFNDLFRAEKFSMSARLGLFLTGDALLKLFHQFELKHEHHLAEAPGCRAYSNYDGDRFQAEARERWIEFTERQHQIFSGLKRPFVTFLQPNQFLPNKKVWSPEETRIFAERNSDSKFIGTYYGLAVRDFLRAGMGRKNWVDLTGIFQNHPETVYSDSCCHLNDHGQSLMLEALWPYILQELND